MGRTVRTSVRRAVIGALFLTPTARGVAEQPPVPISAEEHVEVRLVTIDASVFDAHDRTIPDLRREDFSLRVNAKPVAIDTFDVDCPIGTANPPKGGSSLAAFLTVRGRATPRKFVLAIDYFHVWPDRLAYAFSNLKDAVVRATAAGDEIMLVALAHGAHVEQPFTSDGNSVLAALRRMEKDVTLWNGDYTHLTERPIFADLDDLYHELANAPGAKAMILFSDGAWPAPGYDADLIQAAELASNARTAVYPVLTRGLAAPC